MSTPSSSITAKVVLGYFLLSLGVIVTAYIIYPKLKTYFNPGDSIQETNKKLTFTSNALTYLYEAESLGRTATATGDEEQFKVFQKLIDSLSIQIDSLQRLSDSPQQLEQLDTLDILLARKMENMREMIDLRKEQYSTNYYDQAVADLIREDIYFEDYENSPKVQNVDPYVKRVIVAWNDYIRNDNNPQGNDLENQAAAVRRTLARIERRRKRMETNLIEKENSLLENDRNISLKIRNLLATFEQEALASSANREQQLEQRAEDITDTLKVTGVASAFLALAFIFMVFRDARSNQRYSKELEASKSYAETLLKSREQFMATITHDLRSPLNTLIGFSELLEKTALDGKQETYLQNVKKSSEYMLILVNDLLDFSKLEAGKIHIESVVFNPKNLIQDVVMVAIPSASDSQVEVRTEIDDALDAPFKSDPFRVKQILTNIISNAYKFTERGSVTIQARLSQAQEPTLEVRVVDTGIGIAPEKRKAIFKEFAQADTHIEKRYGGFGLGLAISKRLIDLLKGSIEVESTQGSGSIFTVHIPMKPAELPLNKVKPHAIHKDKRVLIVDDEPLQLELAQEVVSQASVAYDTAVDVTTAMSLLTKNDYDLVLTDIQMPGQDGFELLKQLRQQEATQHIPVISLSGNTVYTQQELLDSGFDHSLKKPYSPQDLLSVLADFMGLELPQSDVEIADADASHSHGSYSLEDLSAFALGDQSSIDSIINLFVSGSKQNIKEMEQAIASEDEEILARVAHRALPMWRQLKVDAVIPMLELLEDTSSRSTKQEKLALATKAIEHMEQVLEEMQERTTA
ncbi:ATP-binding protein [Croceiramulus getboli]|nr:ATP-binding protein [Flavobacteriaceae bacterium YJPT1-3]